MQFLIILFFTIFLSAQVVSASEKDDSNTESSKFLQSIDGYARIRYSAVEGAKGAGQGQQYSAKLNVHTKSMYGYNLSLGFLANFGSSNPKAGSNTDSNIFGAQGFSPANAYNDRLAIATYSINKTQELIMGIFVARVGRIELESPWSSIENDLGSGVKFNLKTSRAQLALSYYDSWMTYNLSYNLRYGNFVGDTYKDSFIGIGSDLAMLTYKAEGLKDKIDLNLGIANAQGLIDFMGFASVKYNQKNFAFLAQSAVTAMNPTPFWRLGGEGIKNDDGNLVNPQNWHNKLQKANYSFENTQFARIRGIYNLQILWKPRNFKEKLGFLGSFGEGYGTMLSNTGALDIAGKFWANNYTNSAEGFGLIGSGGLKNTSIYVLYLSHSHKVGHFNFGLDVSYVSGKNNYIVPDVPSLTRINVATANGAKIYGLDFVEIAPSIAYVFGNFQGTIIWAKNLGDVEWSKARFEVKYNF